MKESFYSHGKLLLTGEYLVLDGAKGLALPTKLGQWLTVENHEDNSILWTSFDENNEVWFKEEFYIKDDSVQVKPDDKRSEDELRQNSKLRNQLRRKF